jgi:hypothetical protein
MFDDLLAYCPGEETDYVWVNLRWSREGPAFRLFALQNRSDLVGQLPVNAPIIFAGKRLSLGDRVHVPAGGTAISNGKPPRLIRDLVDKAAMGVGDVKRLNEPQAGTARRRFIYFVGFEAAAVGNYNERSRRHRTEVSACCATIRQILFARREKITRYFPAAFRLSLPDCLRP